MGSGTQSLRSAREFLYSIFRQRQFPDYYWVADQVEVATDIMFSSRAALQQLMPDLLEHAALHMGAHDILRYMGGKRLCSELCTDHKARPEGRRVKHRLRRNSIKMYDKHSVLRIEMTINNHRQFQVLRVQHTKKGRQVRWMPMRKGVVDFWRIVPLAERANHRYLEALGHVSPTGKAIQELDRLCHSRTTDGRHHAKFHPVSAEDCKLFEAVLQGEHMIHGFRNRDLTQQLYDRPAKSAQEKKRRCARVSRMIAKLRGHRLIAKVPRARLYRVTPAGHRAMSAAIHFRKQHFPAAC